MSSLPHSRAAELGPAPGRADADLGPFPADLVMLGAAAAAAAAVAADEGGDDGISDFATSASGAATGEDTRGGWRCSKWTQLPCATRHALPFTATAAISSTALTCPAAAYTRWACSGQGRGRAAQNLLAGPAVATAECGTYDAECGPTHVGPAMAKAESGPAVATAECGTTHVGPEMAKPKQSVGLGLQRVGLHTLAGLTTAQAECGPTDAERGPTYAGPEVAKAESGQHTQHAGSNVHDCFQGMLFKLGNDEPPDQLGAVKQWLLYKGHMACCNPRTACNMAGLQQWRVHKITAHSPKPHPEGIPKAVPLVEHALPIIPVQSS
eukprot:44842-Pelagomonas_calceolata.AAC.1